MTEQPIDKPTVWFLDTSALLSMAVDEALRLTVQRKLSPERCVLWDVVEDELTFLAKSTDTVRTLARAALGQLGWLGEAVAVEGKADPDRALDIQETIRATRPLRHPYEHWAESVMIEIATRMGSLRPVLLTEDYNARVEANFRGVKALSLHKLLHQMVMSGELDAADAARFADVLHANARGPECTVEEFRSGKLGRVGRP